VSAIWNVSTWVTSGRESQRFASAVPHLLKLVPRGSVVLLSVPEWHQDGWFWSFSTPFALQPPFTEEDFYEKFRIVERPPLYCCPPDRWWNARKPVVMALLDSPSPQYVTRIQFAANNPGSPVFNTRAIDGRALRRQLETALGRPVETVTGTTEEAKVLDTVLFE
jgi:hypothetical protein